MTTSLSFLTDDTSSLIMDAATEERDARSIDVIGRRLLFATDPFAISALVLRMAIGPSRLLGRYRIESLPFVGITARLGVTSPSMKVVERFTRLE
jgi:hypothetical protein